MIKVQNKAVTKAFFGTKEVLKIFNGPDLIWQKDTPPVEESWIMNLNFSKAGVTNDNAAGWNAIRFTVNGSDEMPNITSQSFPNLKDEDDVDRGVTFSVTYSHATPGISDVNVSQSQPIPQVYIRDFWQNGIAAGNAGMIWKLAGLDPSGTYDIRAIPYISGGVNALISVDGGTTWAPNATSYPTTDSFDDPNYITVDGVTPNSSGEILIHVGSGGAGIWFSMLGLRLRKQGPPPVKTLVSIAITPTVLEVPVGNTQQYTAVGTYDDASTENLTTQGSWASSTPSVATVSSTGLVTGISEGGTDITYTVGAIIGTLSIDITEAVGRVFNIGTGSGQVIIDGSNPLFTGGLQAGDKIRILLGNYTQNWPWNALVIRNINLPSGSVKIETTGTTTFQGIDIGGASGPVKGVDIDFRGQDVTINVGSGDGYVEIDKGILGGLENIKYRGGKINFTNANHRGITHKAVNLAYNNGVGPVAIKNFEIHDVNFLGTGLSYYQVIYIGGELITNGSTVVDNGYVENIHVHDIAFNGQVHSSSHVAINNCKNFLVEDVTLDGVNIDDPSVAVYHWRQIYCRGNGVIRNCYARNSGGAVAAIEMYAREAGQVCKIYNVYSYNSWRYGTTEFREYNYNIGVPYMYGCAAEADYLGYYRPTDVPADVYTATCIDNYNDTGRAVDVRNSYAIKPNRISAMVNTGPTGVNTNNLIATVNTSTKIDTNTMVPAADSTLKGAGVNRVSIPTDLNGLTRLNPPTIGPVEAL